MFSNTKRAVALTLLASATNFAFAAPAPYPISTASSASKSRSSETEVERLERLLQIATVFSSKCKSRLTKCHKRSVICVVN